MAITYIDGVFGGFASTATITTGAFSSAVHSGDLLIAVGYLTGLGSQATISVIDNLNSGNYTIAKNTYYGAGGIQTFVAFMVCTATGSANTTTITGGNFSSGGYLLGLHYNGFTGTPTLISADATANDGTSTSYSGTGFTNSKANELLIGALFASSGGTTVGSPGGSWTDRQSGSQFRTMDEQQATAGNSITFAGTLSPSDAWMATLVGFYDAASGGISGVAAAAASAYGALTGPAPAFSPILLDDAAHVGGSDQISLGTGPNTGTGDSAYVAFPKLKQWATDVNTMTSQLYGGTSYQTPTTGFSLVPGPGITTLLVDPAGTLATGTVTMPASPSDKQPLTVMSSQTITSLTVNANVGQSIKGAPTTLSANSSFQYQYRAANTTWYRVR